MAYLSRSEAIRYQAVLRQLEGRRVKARCAAVIVGGFAQDGGKRAHLGVRLDLAAPAHAL